MNRRGDGEELGLFMFLAIMLILLAGIVLGARSFFGWGYDFRTAEADQLRSVVISCFMNRDFFASGFNISQACSIHDDFLERNHLVLIRGLAGPDRTFVKGIADYENQCAFSGGFGNRAYPRCINGTFSKNGESFYYVIASNQQSRRAVTA